MHRLPTLYCIIPLSQINYYIAQKHYPHCFSYRDPVERSATLRGNQQSFIRGGIALRSNFLPFYIRFLAEKLRYPFRILCIDKWYPFQIPSLELCIPFNSCKCTFFKILNQHVFSTILQSYNESVSSFDLFYRPKLQISLPFYILQQVKSLPFHIPEA